MEDIRQTVASSEYKSLHSFPLEIKIVQSTSHYNYCNGVYITNLLIGLVEALASTCSDSDLVRLSRHIVDWESIGPVLSITEAEERKTILVCTTCR